MSDATTKRYWLKRGVKPWRQVSRKHFFRLYHRANVGGVKELGSQAISAFHNSQVRGQVTEGEITLEKYGYLNGLVEAAQMATKASKEA